MTHEGEPEPRRGELHILPNEDCVRGRYELHTLPDHIEVGQNVQINKSTRIMNANGSLAEDWMAKSIAENYLRIGINVGILCHPDDAAAFEGDEEEDGE